MQRIYNPKLNFWGHVMWISLLFIACELLAARCLGVI